MSSAHAGIDPALTRRFERDGFVVVRDLVCPAVLDELRAALDAITTDTVGYPELPRQWFERDGQRFVGHLFFPHRHHPSFLALTRLPAILGHIEAFMGGAARLYASQVMLKGPREDGHVFQPHQDCYYWQFMPAEVITCWFAVDDVTPANGCLTVIPGSHRLGLLEHSSYTSSIGAADGQKAGLWRVSPDVMPDTPMVEAPVPAGGAVFFHGLTIHASRGNVTNAWRRAAGLIYMPDRHTHLLEPARLKCGW